jgi:hypothetical protein
MAEETNVRKENSKCKKKEGGGEKARKNTLPTKKGWGKKRAVEGGKQEDILLYEDV